MQTENIYWHRQSQDKPLFPDLIWSRPESKNRAGKLLIIGGNQYGFAAPAEAFREAERAGAGTIRMILPDSLKQFTGKVFEAGHLVPSTKIGSFSMDALDTMLEEAAWADAVLLAGDIGRNSETAIVIEKFIQQYTGQLTITQDCLDPFVSDSQKLFTRQDTTVVPALGQLQKMWPKIAPQIPVPTSSVNLEQVVDSLHALTQQFPAAIITKRHEIIFTAVNGQVSTTPVDLHEHWRVQTAARASVWWLQNPTMPFEAITTTLIYKS